MIGRLVAIAAVVIVAVAVAAILLSGGSSYQVNAVFTNASQIVTGDQVQVAGNSIGTVSKITLTPNGQADLLLSINNSTYEPLHQGTEATIRMASLSGIADRYVDLRLGSATAPSIANNGVVGGENANSAVDLDELFNALNAPTRKGLQNVIQGSSAQVANQGDAMQAAFAYLNPALAASSVLFSEINSDTNRFTFLITKSAGLVTDLASRSSDLSGLITNLNTTFAALAAQRTALAQSLQQLPGFMRLANTTFVNLRSTLDALTPLVNTTKPAAPKLVTLLTQLRPLARDAVPTVRDLANLICPKGQTCTATNPGRNDLIQLVSLMPSLAGATVQNVNANGAVRPGAFPQTTTALNDSTPELAVARPYAADLTGWFEGFSHPGTIDANGGTSRVVSQNNPPVGSTNNGSLLTTLLLGQLRQIPLLRSLSELLQSNPLAGLTTGQGDRCPGSMERGAVYYPESGFPCSPSEVPTG